MRYLLFSFYTFRDLLQVSCVICFSCLALICCRYRIGTKFRSVSEALQPVLFPWIWHNRWSKITGKQRNYVIFALFLKNSGYIQLCSALALCMILFCCSEALQRAGSLPEVLQLLRLVIGAFYWLCKLCKFIFCVAFFIGSFFSFFVWTASAFLSLFLYRSEKLIVK